jgi:hypothetical protein
MKPAPYTGPEPTIEQLRKQFGWMWACRGIECSHGILDFRVHPDTHKRAQGKPGRQLVAVRKGGCVLF